MLLLRVARMETTLTKAEFRRPAHSEPVFRPGGSVRAGVRWERGVATLAEPISTGDVLLVEETAEANARIHSLQLRPGPLERPWALFGLRLGEEDTIDLWLRDARQYFYRAPRRAEYRLAILRPGEVTRVLHNAKNDFSAASGRERTYRWNDIVFEPLGTPKEWRSGPVDGRRPVLLDGAKIVDLREDLI
ncbi:MAG TPA: hypothetical protein VFQ91_24840 [Bryobacteraceae bacterium]|nr:hypothetical protein [Bryobacteraceae bacterium]